MEELIGGILALALQVGLLAGVALLGRRTWLGQVRRPGRLALIAAGVVTLDVAAWEVLLPSQLGLLPAAPYLECALTGPAVLLLVALLAARLRGTVFGRPVVVIDGLFAACWLFGSAAPLLLLAGTWGLSTDPDEPPLGQATWWSCGSAAVSRATWEMGHPISEYEAARLVATRPFLGTTSVGMVHGMARLGIRARARAFARWEDLRDAPKPCLATTRVFGRVLHVVTVLEASDTEVRLFDPMLGDIELSPEEFRAEWLREMVAPVAQPTTRHTSAVQGSPLRGTGSVASSRQPEGMASTSVR
jgi:predicted double-glycine peptidase